MSTCHQLFMELEERELAVCQGTRPAQACAPHESRRKQEQEKQIPTLDVAPFPP